MTMVEHLEELRRRLMVVIAAIAIGAVAGFVISGPALDILRGPLPDEFDTIYFTSPAGAFVAQLKVAGFVGIGLAMPVILYQIWRFVTPGLLPGERRMLWPFLLAGLLLFGLGVAIGFAIIPYALVFLLGFAREGIEPLLTIDEYIGFVTTLMLVFGLMLQFPIVLIVLSRLGIVTPAWLAARRRWVILLIAIVAAVATPGGDPFSMVILSLLMYGLFEVTLLVVRALPRSASASGSSGTDVDR
ncbi:MAG TPA: twin-arginine translocase subunit TatC [Pleomorphomonadaceae bacterium]|nr:twin-arginine translocase subunit TatC [Pleomorphomonadaceae bacterium]